MHQREIIGVIDVSICICICVCLIEIYGLIDR